MVLDLRRLPLPFDGFLGILASGTGGSCFEVDFQGFLLAFGGHGCPRWIGLTWIECRSSFLDLSMVSVVLVRCLSRVGLRV